MLVVVLLTILLPIGLSPNQVQVKLPTQCADEAYVLGWGATGPQAMVLAKAAPVLHKTQKSWEFLT
jgi:hypothetical protein